MKQKILWIIPKWSFPINDGAKVATDRLVRNLCACGAQIDICCLGAPGERVEKEYMRSHWGVRRIHYYQRKLPASVYGKVFFYLGKILSSPSTPLTMSSFVTDGVREFVKEILDREHYDWVVMDGLHLGGCFLSGRQFLKHPNVGKWLYRAHNIEQDLWDGAARKSAFWAKRSFYNYQKKRVAKFEESIIKAADLVAPISQEDLGWIQQNYPTAKTKLAPLGMDFSSPLEPSCPLTSTSDEFLNFLFLGRLDWPPNRDGLRWLLENVWPKVDARRVKLHVAGSGDGKWLKKYLDLPGVVYHGFVPEIDPLYRKCDATIAPIFYGSGTRIKVVESYAKGRPVITTEMGAQGTGLSPKKGYIKAQGPKEWLEQISGYDRKIGIQIACEGRGFLSQAFDEKMVAGELYHAMS